MDQIKDGNFVIAYLGNLPKYLIDCIKQIRIWNPTTEIWIGCSNLVNNVELLKNINTNVNIIYIDTLTITSAHETFNKTYTNNSMNNFWKYTMERFFIVEEIMLKYNLTNVLHLEVDNMIYFNLKEILPIFKKVSKEENILIPSDNSTRYIAGVCYIPTPNSIANMNIFFSLHNKNQAEMEVIMQFNGNVLSLPVVMPEYPHSKLCPIDGKADPVPLRLSKYAEDFGGLFDAAAIGQYMFGIDKIHNKGNTDGFINTHSVYRINEFQTRWNYENKYLEIKYDSRWWRVFNIHVHSKELSRGFIV